MTAAARPRPNPPAARTGGPESLAKGIVLAAVLLAALGFVLLYVFRYYLNYDEASFNDPIRGAPNYWRDRGWLLLHISGGSLAILSGPWQFWTGFRARHLRWHRWTGRVFLLGVALGSVGAVRLALDTSFGWAYGVALGSLALAWLATTGTAFYAIRTRQIQAHKEWMIRAYVVTFAFVTTRVLEDYTPLARMEQTVELFLTTLWTSWTIPLLMTEVILQARRWRKSA